MLLLFYLTLTTLFIAQSIYSLFLNLYAWKDIETYNDVTFNDDYAKPSRRFTVYLPAYKEEAVLGETIRKVSEIDYPKHLFNILIILQPSDTGTIAVAKKALSDNKIENAQIIIVNPNHTPLNKPYQLNVALRYTAYEQLVIFDSEDDVHPDILNLANTAYEQNPDVDIIQGGVQLMNYTDRWFSAHNVLEYFFWFKSRMHYHMRVGATTLGGNTVFFKTKQLKDIGGWNEHCLTEDGEIGLRLSVKGSKKMAVYSPALVTKEETPLTYGEFIKQRTRWAQGFLQTLQLGEWRKLSTRPKRLLALYLIAFPVFQTLIFFISPLTIYYGIVTDLSLVVSLYAFIPMLLFIGTVAVMYVGLMVFIKEQDQKFSIKPFLHLWISILPYQILLSVGAVRALWRHIKGQTDWEKTAHAGVHRSSYIEKLEAVEVQTA